MMERALKAVFQIHRKTVQDLRRQLLEALQDKEQIQRSLEQKCKILEQEVDKLEQEKQSLLTAPISAAVGGKQESGSRSERGGACSVDSSQTNADTDTSQKKRNMVRGCEQGREEGEGLTSAAFSVSPVQSSVPTAATENITCSHEGRELSECQDDGLVLFDCQQEGAEEKKDISPRLQLSRRTVKRKRYTEDTKEKRCKVSSDTCSSLLHSQSSKPDDSAQKVISSNSSGTMDSSSFARHQTYKCTRQQQLTSESCQIIKTTSSHEMTASSLERKTVNLYIPETCQLDSTTTENKQLSQKHTRKEHTNAVLPGNSGNMQSEVVVVPETLVVDFAAVDGDCDIPKRVVVESFSGESCNSDDCTTKQTTQLTPYAHDHVFSNKDAASLHLKQSQETLSGQYKHHMENTGHSQVRHSVTRRKKRKSQQELSSSFSGTRPDSVVFDITMPIISQRISRSCDIPCSNTSVVCEEQNNTYLGSPVFAGHKMNTADVSPALFEEADNGFQSNDEITVSLPKNSKKQFSSKFSTPTISDHRNKIIPKNLESPASPLLLRPQQKIANQAVFKSEGSVAAPVHPLETELSHKQQAHWLSETTVGKKVALPVYSVQRRNLFKRKELRHTVTSPASNIPSADETVDPLFLDLRSPEQELTVKHINFSAREKTPIEKRDAPFSGTDLSPKVTQLNASLDPGVHLTQYLEDSPADLGDHPCQSPTNQNDLDMTLNPSFKQVHQTSAQDITLISQSSSVKNVLSNNGQNSVDDDSKRITGLQLLNINLDDSYDRAPKKKEQHKFAFKKVVRKRADRKKLKGFSCHECLQYYRAAGITDEEALSKMTHCSRHRGHYTPPNTPEHFWSIGFPDTQECAERGYHN